MIDSAIEPAAPRARIIVPFVIVTLIWGSTWLVIKDQVGTVPPTWSITYRFALAAIGMFVLAMARREPLRLSRQGMLLAALVGFTQFFANFQFVYRAEQYLTSGVVAVLYALLMVPNAVLARVFLGEPVSRRFLAGSAVALGGIALLLLHEYRIAPPAVEIGLGIALAFTGLFCASASNVLQANQVGRSQPLVPLLAWAMVWGTLADAAFSIATAGPPQFDARWEYIAGIVYLALFGSVITFPLYFGLIREMGAGRAAYSGVAVPVVAMALSTAFEGYRWTGLAIAGAVLAIGGLLMALSARKKAA